jgi:peptidoglycan/LPS O-acetylase OafA/YrhL
MNQPAAVSVEEGSVGAGPVQSIKPSKKHIPGLDGVRGLAILAVMGFHFSNESGFAPVFKPFHIGWIGVDLFFVLSGFLISGILLESRDTPHYFFNFYARRALRIFPLYYTFLLVMLVIYLLSGDKIVPNLDQTIHTWPWWVFYGSNIIAAAKGWIFPAMGVFWSLAVEEHFYLFWPAVVRFLSPPALRKTIIGIILGSVGLRCFLWSIPISHPLVFYVLTPCRLDGLGIGAGLAVIHRLVGLESIRGWMRLAIIIGGAGFALAVLWGRDASFNNSKMFTFGYFCLDVMCGGFLAIAVMANPSHWLYRILNGHVLKFFGKYSYALYVLHSLVTIILAARLLPFLTKHLQSTVVAPVCFALVSFSCSILLSLASWNLLEKHALNLKRFFK